MKESSPSVQSEHDADASRPLVVPASPWARIKEHKVLQWSLAYLGAALAVAHGQELLAHNFHWPEVVGHVLIGTLIVGFPIAVALAWYHGHRGMTRISAGEMTVVSMLLLIAAVLLISLVRVPEEGAAEPDALGVTAARSVPSTRAGSSPPMTGIARFEILPPDQSQSFGAGISPDGTGFLFVAVRGDGPRVWLRRVDSLQAQPLAGTERATGIPFFSPDGRFIVFGTEEGKLKKIDMQGGPAEVLCDSGGLILGGFWHGDRIVFADVIRPPGLWEVGATGGLSSPLPGFDSAITPYFPRLLPDGVHFLYRTEGGLAAGDVYVASLGNKRGGQGPKRLLTGVGGFDFAPSPSKHPYLGYLLFERQGTGVVMAQPFDLRRLDLVGEAVPIAQDVAGGDFTASLTGTLFYRFSGIDFDVGELTIFDRQGNVLGKAGEPGGYLSVAFSPDGKRVIAARRSESSANLWMMDLMRGISTRFTFDAGIDEFPVWSPDGNRVAFASIRESHTSTYQKLANGGGDDELLYRTDKAVLPLSWSSDGHFLLLNEGTSPGTGQAGVLRLDENGRAVGVPHLLPQKGVGIDLRFSPGSQGGPPPWVAYSSDESGRYEIYVRPFDPDSPTGAPPGGGKWQVSTGGGISPRWSGNGRELFYMTPDGTVMSVEVDGGAVFQYDTPKVLFKAKRLAQQNPGFTFWDASPDGKKFILPVSASNAHAPLARFAVVQNWPLLLQK